MSTVTTSTAAELDRQRERDAPARGHARLLPIVPVRAEGMTVHGADGRVYLDCLAGAGALALGHNHPATVEAIRRVLDSGAPLYAADDLASPVKDEFTEALLGILPPELAKDARVQFCGTSGADAVAAALELARTATGNTGVVAFTASHHGMSTSATRLPFPQDYRCPYSVGGIGGVRIATEQLRRSLTPAGLDSGLTSPAALIVEPVQDEGGVIPAPAEWLRHVRAETAAHDVVLIADETQTGLGRTGELWGVDHAGIVPDVMVLPKAVGGGLPLAAMVYRGELAWAEGAHAGTFAGQQLAMAAGAATIKYVLEHDLATGARKIGERMRAAFEDAAREVPAIGDVRGRGLMIGVEVVDPDGAVDALGARAAAPGLARKVRTAAMERGLLVELGGRRGAVVRLLPPLTITDAEADRVVAILIDAMVAAQQQLPRLRTKTQGPKPDGAMSDCAMSDGATPHGLKPRSVQDAPAAEDGRCDTPASRIGRG